MSHVIWPIEHFIENAALHDALSPEAELDLLTFMSARLGFLLADSSNSVPPTQQLKERAIRLRSEIGRRIDDLGFRANNRAHSDQQILDSGVVSIGTNEPEALEFIVRSRRRSRNARGANSRPSKCAAATAGTARPIGLEANAVAAHVHALNKALLLQSSRQVPATSTTQALDNPEDDESEALLADMESMVRALKSGGQALHDRLVADNAVLDATTQAAQANVDSAGKAVKDLEAENRASLLNLCATFGMLATVALTFAGCYTAMKLLGKPPPLPRAKQVSRVVQATPLPVIVATVSAAPTVSPVVYTPPAVAEEDVSSPGQASQGTGGEHLGPHEPSVAEPHGTIGLYDNPVTQEAESVMSVAPDGTAEELVVQQAAYVPTLHTGAGHVEDDSVRIGAPSPSEEDLLAGPGSAEALPSPAEDVVLSGASVPDESASPAEDVVLSGASVPDESASPAEDVVLSGASVPDESASPAEDVVLSGASVPDESASPAEDVVLSGASVPDESASPAEDVVLSGASVPDESASPAEDVVLSGASVPDESAPSAHDASTTAPDDDVTSVVTTADDAADSAATGDEPDVATDHAIMQPTPDLGEAPVQQIIDDQAAPAAVDDQAVSAVADEQAVPAAVDEQAVPAAVDEQAVPVDEQAVPAVVDDQAVPVDDQAVPVDDQAVPVDDQAVPVVVDAVLEAYEHIEGEVQSQGQADDLPSGQTTHDVHWDGAPTEGLQPVSGHPAEGRPGSSADEGEVAVEYDVVAT